MRKINELIWHCTATREGQHFERSDVDAWHKQRGWSGIGYHKLVLLDGSVQEGRPESKVGAHTGGRNANTIGYAYVGGVGKDGKTPKDTRTDAQKKTMIRLTKEAVKRYGLKKVSGHHDYAAKACPSFPARQEYAPLVNAAYGLMSAGEAGGKPEVDNPQGRFVGASVGTGTGSLGVGLSDAAAQVETLSWVAPSLRFLFIGLTVASVGYGLYVVWDNAGRPLPDFLAKWLGRDQG